MNQYDPLDVRAQERARADAEIRGKLARETEEGDVKWLMSSRRGRRIVWRILERCGVFRLSFNSNSMTMAFNEGQRNEGLRLLSLIHQLCPELYPVMVREQNERNTDDGHERNDH